MFCETCGEEIQGNIRFCPKCGNAISVTEIVTEGGIVPVASEDTKMEPAAVQETVPAKQDFSVDIVPVEPVLLYGKYTDEDKKLLNYGWLLTAIGIAGFLICFLMSMSMNNSVALSSTANQASLSSRKAARRQTDTVSYQVLQEESGLQALDTITLEAMDDAMERIYETIEIDISAFDEDAKEQIIGLCDAMIDSYQAVEGVSCGRVINLDHTAYTFRIDIDATGNAVKELTDAGLLEIGADGDGGKLSLSAIAATLESRGYVKADPASLSGASFWKAQ